MHPWARVQRRLLRRRAKLLKTPAPLSSTKLPGSKQRSSRRRGSHVANHWGYVIDTSGMEDYERPPTIALPPASSSSASAASSATGAATAASTGAGAGSNSPPAVAASGSGSSLAVGASGGGAAGASGAGVKDENAQKENSRGCGGACVHDLEFDGTQLIVGLEDGKRQVCVWLGALVVLWTHEGVCVFRHCAWLEL